MTILEKMFQSGVTLFFLLVFHAICFTSAQEDFVPVEVKNGDVGAEGPFQSQDALPPPHPPQVGQLFDSDLANSFLTMQKRLSGAVGNPNGPPLEEISIPKSKSNQIFTAFSDSDDNANATLPRDPAANVKLKKQRLSQFDDFYDLSPDLIGGELDVKSRQIGKTREQMGFNGSMDGFKDQGDFLPWMLLTESTPSGTDNTSPGTGITDDTSEGTTKPPIIPPDGAPINSVHVLPLKPVPRNSIYGRCASSAPAEEKAICFGYPEGCIDDLNCRMAVSLARSPLYPNEIIVAMAATAPKGFIAVGFSEDRFMGDDAVINCNNIPKTKWMTMHLSVNLKDKYFSKVQTNEDNFQRDFTPIQGYAQDNGVITCEFRMNKILHPDKSEGGKKRRRKRAAEDAALDPFQTAKYIFLAFGRHSEVMDPNSTEFGQLKFHHLVTVSSDDDSDKLQNLIEKGIILSPRSFNLMLLHIIPYTVTFSFLLPCAIFMGKYGREAYSNVESGFFGLPRWLAIHVGFQNVAVILSILGLIGIVSELGGAWRTKYFLPVTHCVVGLIATVGLWINFLLGWTGYFLQTRNNAIDKINNDEGADFDTDIDDDDDDVKKGKGMFSWNYNYFKWVHWGLGTAVYWFGMAALVVTFSMKRALVPCVIMFIVILQILIHILTHIVMTIHTSWLVTHVGGHHWRRRVYPGPMIGFHKEEIDPKFFVKEDTKFNEMRIWCGRRRAIIFYFITSLFSCIGLLGLLAFPTVLCRTKFFFGKK